MEVTLTSDEQKAVASALQAAFMAEEMREVPAWERAMIPANIIPTLANIGANISIHTLDAYRAKKAAEPK